MGREEDSSQTQENEAAETAAVDVRSGLRAARNENEVKVLIQRALALNLHHEVDLGKHKLRQLQESSAPPRTAEGAFDHPASNHASPVVRSMPPPPPPAALSPGQTGASAVSP